MKISKDKLENIFKNIKEGEWLQVWGDVMIVESGKTSLKR